MRRLFYSLVSAIDAVYGSSMKTNIELIDIGAQIFPQLGHNVIRNADYDFEKMKGKYSIVNTDNGVVCIGSAFIKRGEYCICSTRSGGHLCGWFHSS